jgi:putative DNA primase/helicase
MALRINCNNGILCFDEKTGKMKLEPHDPKYFFTKVLRANYNPDATCPVFMKVLNKALPDKEDQELLGLYMANVLLPDARFQVCLICMGITRTGKSTISNAFADALGRDVVTAFSLQQICEEKGVVLADMEFAILNLCAELDERVVQNSSMFKLLVCGEEVGINPKFKPARKTRIFTKFWFCTNHMPVFTDGTDANHGRVRIIEMNQQISNDETDVLLGSVCKSSM